MAISTDNWLLNACFKLSGPLKQVGRMLHWQKKKVDTLTWQKTVLNIRCKNLFNTFGVGMAIICILMKY